jgi:4-hydroxybutyrate CoA-transferase
MDWRQMVGEKLMSPEAAVEIVKPGDQVSVGFVNVTPFTLCEALYERRSELQKVRIDHAAPLFPWVRPGDEGPFELYDFYATAADRDLVNSGQVHYLPAARWREGELPDGCIENPDVYMVSVSPPDRHGYCSFGPGVFFSPTYCQRAKTVIAEVHENFIRTGGQNYVHLSRIDRMCEARLPSGTFPVQPPNEEENLVTEVIGTLVATELIRDRDTLQLGIGTVASAMGAFLEGKHDLGLHTEIITGGIADLVQAGVINGKYKTLHPGKAVASAALVPIEEWPLIDNNPSFEFYEFSYIDDVRVILHNDNLVAINNALMVDLTGQVSSETIGPRIWTGVGGQTAFSIAANYSSGGRSVIVLPSSHLIGGERVSRIVPALPEGSVVTVPRTLVDYVVTEHGIASLRGKSHRERIGELVSISHPDLRAELQAEVRSFYGLDV